LYNILIELGIPKKLVRLIKMCLPETYSRVWVGKNLSDMFPSRNGLKEGNAVSLLLLNFALEYAIICKIIATDATYYSALYIRL